MSTAFFTKSHIWTTKISDLDGYSRKAMLALFKKSYDSHKLSKKTLLAALKDFYPAKKGERKRQDYKSKFDQDPELCELKNFIHEMKNTDDIDSATAKKIWNKVINLLRTHQNTPMLK